MPCLSSRPNGPDALRSGARMRLCRRERERFDLLAASVTRLRDGPEVPGFLASRGMPQQTGVRQQGRI